MGSGSTRPRGRQTYLRSKDRDATFHQRGLEKGQFNRSKEPSVGSVGCRVCPVAVQVFHLVVEVEAVSKMTRRKRRDEKAGKARKMHPLSHWGPTDLSYPGSI